MPATELLRAGTMGRPIAVDRKANALRGYCVAQLGPFKTPGRGEFNLEGLQMIEKLGNDARQGLKSRLNHVTMCDDGLGNYLGRSQDFFMSEATNADGVKVPAVRADLIFDQTAMETPPKGGGKPIGVYVMDLAESDSDALSSSLVVKVKKEYRRKPDGTLQTGPNGEDLPPLWYPEKLYGSDIVDTGDAVDGLLSAEGLSHGEIWKGTELLDGLFEGKTREEVEERLKGWLDRYLTRRFGEDESKLGGYFMIGPGAKEGMAKLVEGFNRYLESDRDQRNVDGRIAKLLELSNEASRETAENTRATVDALNAGDIELRKRRLRLKERRG